MKVFRAATVSILIIFGFLASAAIAELQPNTIPWAKVQPDNTPVSISNAVVSAKFGSALYIQTPVAFAGIRVVTTGADATVGDLVDISGTAGGYGLERVLYATTATVSQAGYGAPSPILINLKNLGGADFGSGQYRQLGATGANGVNNVGLLIKAVGRVASVDESNTFFVMTDDSGTSVIVDATRLSILPNADDLIAATGISKLFGSIGNAGRMIAPRSDSDISILNLQQN